MTGSYGSAPPGASDGQRIGAPVSAATASMTSDAVSDCCSVVISRLLAAGLDLELALRSPQRVQATRRIQRAVGEVNASLRELHQTMLDAALRGSPGNGEAARPPLITEDPHG
jgi:hypothetical protein